MSSVDLIMDVESLGILLQKLNIPKDKFNDYKWLMTNLKADDTNQKECESALRLVYIIFERLK